MGITVHLNTEDVVTFVPDFQNNREEAADGESAFEVDILPMSGADYDKLHSAMMGGSKRSARSVMKHAKAFFKRIFVEHVVAVRGFTARGSDGSVVEEPKNGSELYRVCMLADAATADLVDHIVEAVKDHSVLTEGDLGKLRQRYASFAPKTRGEKSGRVSDAEDPNSKPGTQSLTSGSISARPLGEFETATEAPPSNSPESRGTLS